MKKFWLAFGILLSAGVVEAATFYVQQGGSGTTCSSGSPGALQTGFSGLCTGWAAGDDIYLKPGGGIFTGTYHAKAGTPGATDDFVFRISVSGTSSNRTVIKTDPAAQTYYGQPSTLAHVDCAVLDTDPSINTKCILLNGNYLDVENIWTEHVGTTEVRETLSGAGGNTPPKTYIIHFGFPGNASGYGVDNRLINVVSNDMASWSGSKGQGAYPYYFYGNIITNFGYNNVDASQTYGQGLYIQNGATGFPSPTTVTWKDNIVSGALPYTGMGNASFTFQIYGSCGAWKKNLWFEGNYFGGGRNIAGGCNQTTFDPNEANNTQTFYNNIFMGYIQMCAYGDAAVNVTYNSNYFSNTSITGRAMYFDNSIGPCKPGMTINGNTIVGGTYDSYTPAEFPGSPANTYYATSFPTTNYTMVRPNAFTVGRCTVNIINYEDKTAQTVNLSTCGLANGEQYEIRYGLNYVGSAVATGTYNSASPTVSFPLTVASNPISNSHGTKVGGAAYQDLSQPLRGSNLMSAPFVVNQTSGTIPTPTNTPSFTNTATATRTSTFTPSLTSTRTFTNTATRTPTATATVGGPTATNTFTPSVTPTPTQTPTATRTFTASQTPTRTPTPAAGGGLSTGFRYCSLTAPMAVVVDATSLVGGYVTSDTANSGVVACTFAITQESDYTIWTRLKYTSPQTDALFVQIDNDVPECDDNGDATCTHIYDVRDVVQPCTAPEDVATCLSDVLDPNVWVWNRVNDRAPTNTCGVCPAGIGTQRVFHLTVGTHTVKFRNRDTSVGVSTMLDYMVISNDPSYVPIDPQPTPTPVPGNVGPVHRHPCSVWPFNYIKTHRHTPDTLQPGHTHADCGAPIK